MENNYKEERFDSFLNKTIIMSSRTYFKKQMNIANKENTILDNENYFAFLQGAIDSNCSFSDIEQAVIFLLFKEELSQDEAGKILEICSKSVSRIKLRAIEKLKRYFEGDIENEK